jgi:hypothetical protein
LPTAAAVERFFDSPGALFLQRDTVIRMTARGSLLRIERKPGRTVACRWEAPSATMRDALQKMKSDAAWARVPMA